MRPIHRLTQAARAFGSGHLGHRVTVTSSAELQEMAETFNSMAEALQEQHRQLERQAFTDSLTGIANRALFEDRARHALNRSLRTHEQIAVLMVDLDDFKLVNDGLGHSSGDELIALAARRISDETRPSDTVARLGGDEFAVLLENVHGLDDALAAAERIRRLFDTPFDLDGSDVVVSASIGIAMALDSLDAEELLRRADLAMYRVKADGKDGTAFFDTAMEDRAVARLDVLSALRKAVERDELVTHYQPIVDLETGEIVAAEALLRWGRPGHGLVAPLDFIPIAEETGLILPIGAWVLKEACTQAREWRANGSPTVRVNVNVSARQLVDPASRRSSATRSRNRAGARRTRPRGHRVVGDAGPRRHDPQARPDHPDRRASHARRLRRGLLLAQPPPAPPRPGTEDRPSLHQGARRRRLTPRARDHRARAQPRAATGRRRHRGARAARRAARAGMPAGTGFLFARPLELPGSTHSCASSACHPSAETVAPRRAVPVTMAPWPTRSTGALVGRLRRAGVHYRPRAPTRSNLEIALTDGHVV